MLDGLILRRAKAKDIEAMAALISLIFAVEEDFCVDAEKQKSALNMFLEYPEGRYLLAAEYQGNIIGMCSAQLLLSTAEGGWKAVIEDVVVKQEYRGMGVGQNMLAALSRWAASQGVKRLDLLADCDNANGMKFYDKLLWKKTNLIALQKKEF